MVEHNLEHKDGREIPAGISLSTVEVQEGRLVPPAIRDITVRKRAEAALQASEIRYRRLFEAAQDGILILDFATGQVVDVNPFLTNLLGYSHAELVGRDLWEIGPDVMTIADEVDAQLTQTMDSYMNVMRKAGAA